MKINKVAECIYTPTDLDITYPAVANDFYNPDPDDDSIEPLPFEHDLDELS